MINNEECSESTPKQFAVILNVFVIIIAVIYTHTHTPFHNTMVSNVACNT